MTHTQERNAFLDLLRSGSGGRGVLITIKRDGRPQLSTVGFSYDDAEGVIRIASTEDRAKSKNLKRDHRASFYVTAEGFGSYVVAECTAEVSPTATAPDDPVVDELIQMYRSTQGEHHDWAEFRASKVADRRLVIRLRVERTYGFIMPGR
ncbi:PPOX class F420-dependent oxidoreductase [Spongiactinospora rosea]|uniref:PPOX class F420-dependent oxidoreductase n=1 Tax=Spongiactinospora rosea TaxID=2248750 RepID=A0A366M3S9_9ACTN|nr:PPOX class F420-dependent oxidoreductase [Spongiactinospora rosea]RBQ20082.1 PPOX class F420-dependent oxidoreductase [Spongiactinospora rosea]